MSRARIMISAHALDPLAYPPCFIPVSPVQDVFSHFTQPILVDLPLIINGLFCAAAGMITFGAVLGKATPSQILWLVIWQVPFYSLNQWLVYNTFQALDIGGGCSEQAAGLCTRRCCK